MTFILFYFLFFLIMIIFIFNEETALTKSLPYMPPRMEEPLVKEITSFVNLAFFFIYVFSFRMHYGHLLRWQSIILLS